MQIIKKSFWGLTLEEKQQLSLFDSVKLSKTQRVINFFARYPNRLFIKIYLLFIDGVVVGLCVTSFNIIVGLQIHQDHQRRGLGRELVDYVVGDLRRYKEVKVKPVNDSEEFYHKLGFR